MQKTLFGSQIQNLKKETWLYLVTYQIKGFDSLINIKMEKMSFGVMGPLQAQK